MSIRAASPVNWGLLIVLVLAMGILLFFLLTEHTAHLYGILPFLFLLACPFLHMLGHRHDGNSHRHEDRQTDDRESPSTEDHHH